MSAATHEVPVDRSTVLMRVVLLGVFASSVVHYTDNYLRFDAYAQGNAGLITKPVIAVSWVLFTVLGIVSYRAYRGGRWAVAAWCLAAYSVSGLISPLHYTTVPPSSYDAVQHTFIVSDLLAGLAALGFALRIISTRIRPAR
jgi:Na+-driven multidrug efflux pump